MTRIPIIGRLLDVRRPRLVAVALAAGLGLGAAPLALPETAEARSPFKLNPETTMSGAEPLVSEVQYRGRSGYRIPGGYYRGGTPRYGHYPRYPRYGYYPRYPRTGYYPSYRYRYSPGAAVAAGVAGLALGAVVGSQARSGYYPARGSTDWYAYCARKYRSFDPRSGTYLGYDGRRHYCRVP